MVICLMMRCLKPITIPKPGLPLAPLSCPPGFWRDKIRPFRYEQLTVPCGKCLACLKNRQDTVSVRCIREAEKRGSFAFVTLTYADSFLPLAKSLWKVDKDTGELVCLSPSELMCEAQDDNFQSLRWQFSQKKASSIPRYIDLDFWQGNNPNPNQEIFVRVTPTCCRRDVRLWLKRSRVEYEREHGFKLPDFSYIVVSEYGPRSCRPHYHLAFFGLNRLEINWLVSKWTFGFTYTKMVPRVNDDKSDAWQLASRYIGKYMSKGKFDCQSVIDRCAERPRLCASKGFGIGDVEKLKPFVYCWDIVGKYDPFTLCKPSGSKLSDEELMKVISEVPKRLFYRISEKSIVALPRYLRQLLFYKVCENDKTKKTPSSLWYLVADNIRTEFAQKCDREFREFLSGYSEGEISKACYEFAVLQEVNSSASDALLESSAIDFYRRSRF